MDNKIISASLAGGIVGTSIAGVIDHLSEESGKKFNKIIDESNQKKCKTKHEKYMDDLSAVEKTLKVIGLAITTFMAIYTATNTIMKDFETSDITEDDFFKF